MEDAKKREPPTRPPPDEAALKQQERKKRKLDKAKAMETGQWDRCLFKVVRKNRYCNNQRIEGTEFCGNHVPSDVAGCSNRSQQFKAELRVRVPCPLDGSHSVYAFDLDKHVKVCNKLREAAAAKSLPFYSENINSGTHAATAEPVVAEATGDDGVEDEVDGEQQETTVHSEPTPQQEHGLIDRLAALDFPGLVRRIHAAYDKCVGEIPLQKRHHPCCDVLLAEKTAARASKNVLRHIEQQASILGNMDQVQLLEASAAFLELGAGRGMLSLALAQALPDSLYVLIDRAGGRGKADHIIRDGSSHQPRVMRAKIDIRHLNLSAMQALQDSPAVVGMSKHLCGVATDLSLRSLRTLSRGATDIEGKLSTKLKGLAVALCCHHVCRWEDYVSPEFFVAQGFSVSEFALLCAMTSWATCAMGITGDSVEHVLDISQADRAVLGRKCKRILDSGRVDYLRSLGLEAKLIHYCDVQESVENCLLLAWSQPPSLV